MNLYAHQKKIIDDDPKYVGIFQGTGSGKTLTSLCLGRGKVLVICLKTQREDRNWEREVEKNGLKYIVAKEFIFKNELVDSTKCDVIPLTVMSKEEFRKKCQEGTIEKFDTIIVDEAHTCLGVTPNVKWVKKIAYPKTSQLFEALQGYVEKFRPKRLYLVTATIMKSPMTVWGAGVILGKWDVNTFYQFRDIYYIRLPIPGREIFKPKDDHETKERLAETVRNLGYTGRLEDYFDVPEQTYKTIYVDLLPKQKERIKELKIEYPEPIVRVGKIHQVENGVLAGDEFNEPEAFECGKLAKILDLAVEFPKMVIFVKYKAQIDQIQKALTKEGYATWTLTGDTKDRGSIIKQANESADGIFIAQAQISAGWELPGFPVMVFASKTYSFVDYDQALGRIQRSNNIKKNLYINLVVKGGADEAVEKCIINKQDFNERIYSKEI